MPVRLLTSSVLKWPEHRTVDRAVRRWAKETVKKVTAITRIGYFGSYARGDWGVGSDLDLLIIVRETDKPFERRSLAFDTTRLPVPADLLIYTEEEWYKLMRENSRFFRTLQDEVEWVYKAKA